MRQEHTADLRYVSEELCRACQSHKVRQPTINNRPWEYLMDSVSVPEFHAVRLNLPISYSTGQA